MNAYLGAALKSPVSFVQERHDTFAAIRRDLHAHPELGYEEHRTAALVAERLHQWCIEVHTAVGRTGVVGVIRGKRDASGRSVGLRADMDALPVVEQTGLPYASTVKSTYQGQEVGVMHACGHDTHVAMLMGVATVLAGSASKRRTRASSTAASHAASSR